MIECDVSIRPDLIDISQHEYLNVILDIDEPSYIIEDNNKSDIDNVKSNIKEQNTHKSFFELFFCYCGDYNTNDETDNGNDNKLNVNSGYDNNSSQFSNLSSEKLVKKIPASTKIINSLSNNNFNKSLRQIDIIDKKNKKLGQGGFKRSHTKKINKEIFEAREQIGILNELNDEKDQLNKSSNDGLNENVLDNILIQDADINDILSNSDSFDRKIDCENLNENLNECINKDADKNN